MPGLLASGLLGGLAQAGAAGGDYVAKSGLLQQQGAMTLDLEKIKDEMASKRETALQELRGSQEMERTEATIASHEKTSAAQLAALKNSAKAQGLTVQTDAEGNMGVADMQGRTFKPFVGEDGKPVRGLKDLPLTIKTYVATVNDRLKALDKEESSGMVMGDALQGLQRRREALNAEMLTALTTGKLPGAVSAQDAGSRPPLASFRGGSRPAPAAPAAPKARSIAELTKDIGVITQQLNDPNLRDEDRASLQTALSNLSKQIAAQNQ